MALALVAGTCLGASLLAGCRNVLPLFLDSPSNDEARPTQRTRKDLLKEVDALRRELNELRRLQGAPVAEPAVKVVPSIQRMRTWREALKLLPTAAHGHVDWMAAVRGGVVSPRRTLRAYPDELQAPVPDFEMVPENFELVPDRERQFAVTFSHQSHLAWLQCVNCHPDPFPGRRAGTVQITMAKIFEGEFCGRCHGKVAFDMHTGCLRCHRKLLQPVATATDAGVQPLGERLYDEKCATCHGIEGNGDGPKVPFFETKPRDFTKGIFKVRSTPSGSLPTDADLFQAITRGMPGTAMPAWADLSEENRRALVAYIKTFSPRFREERPLAAVKIPDPIERTAQAVAEGKELFRDAGCLDCHGEQGRGDGQSARDMKDDWGDRVRPANLTRPEAFRGGATERDIYMRLMTGLSGTPMPSFADSLEPEQVWKLVFYVQSLADAEELPGTVYGDIVWQREDPPNSTPVAPAVFPHWFHRVRFACIVCHPSITKMQKGASGITMDGIQAGKFCGACHNGRIAWPVTFESCNRCHKGSLPAPVVVHAGE